MMCVLNRIEHVGPGLRARRLCFDDASYSRVTSASVIKELHLVEGIELDVENLGRLLPDVEYRLAKERALVLIRQRERSARETADRLCDLGYPRTVADSVLQRFTELDLLNDERFALMWARSRRANGYGRVRVSRELAEKGVSPEVIQDVIGQIFDIDSEITDARAALGNHKAFDRGEREKLIRRLLNRGFDLRVAIEAVGQNGADVQDF